MQKLAQQSVFFPDLFSKPVQVDFSRQSLSSNGGLLLLHAADRRMGLSEALISCLTDRRQPAKVRHSLLEQWRQRVYGLAAGYPDANDAGALSGDPLMQLLCKGRTGPESTLASQPSLSRFENGVDARTLVRMGHALAKTVLRDQARRRQGARRTRRIWIDVDPTCDPTYGAQQMSLFNGFYGTSCYLPMVVTVSWDGEARKYPVAAILRPGNADSMKGLMATLRPLVRLLRRYFPHTPLGFRADSAFGRSDLFDWLEAQKITYFIAFGRNSVLHQEAGEALEVARCLATQNGQSEALYIETDYRAKTWSRSRRVAIKAQVVSHPGRKPRDNDRYVVTNSRRGLAGYCFRTYYGHSDQENTIKELKLDLWMDRTSCSSFLANQFRLLLSLAAYVLMQAVQERSGIAELARLQMGTLRLWLFRVAVRVRTSVRRIRLEFTEHYPWALLWRRCALALGATPAG